MPVEVVEMGGAPQRRGWFRRAFYEDARRRPGGRHAPQMPRFVPTLVVGLIATLLAGWLIFIGFARLGGSTITPWSSPAAPIPASDLADLTRNAVTTAGLLAGV